jgi:hypothetical protein
MKNVSTTLAFALFISALAILNACSSPEADGKKVAEKFCDCEQEAVDSRQKEYLALAQKFDSYEFKTRVEVREKIQAVVDKAAGQRQDCLQGAQKTYLKVSGKYATNYEKNTKFEYAYQGYISAHPTEEEDVAPLVSQINKLILSIIPPKPDVEKIKLDLVGRKIMEQRPDHQFTGWKWLVKENDIKDIHIVGEKKQGDDCLFEVRLILQAEGGAYEVNINLTYVLRQYDDWKLDFLENKEVNIVKTGKYDNCITTQIKGWSGEFQVEFTNNCDVALLIGGAVLSEFGGEWKYFSKIVEANGEGHVGGLFSISVKDYKIHFIEKP